jgi:hypothetical protein
MSQFPYGAFDLATDAADARRLDRMSNIYHRGQALIWNGRDMLSELLKKHDGTHVAPDKRAALRSLFGTLMWGELAAWKISAQLADRIVPLGAKMAATSQAHDEARHFYVLHDYLAQATGEPPHRMYPSSERLLQFLMETDDLPSKILGMQLQVETAALTIFQHTREAKLCPVLSDLLAYYEKDEARHVGLGMQYLPILIRKMNRLDSARFTAAAIRITWWLLQSNRAMEADMRVLGLDPHVVLRLAKSKQLLVFEELWSTAPGSRSRVGDVASQLMQAIASGLWPSPERTNLTGRLREFGHALIYGVDTVQTTIDPVVEPGRAN